MGEILNLFGIDFTSEELSTWMDDSRRYSKDESRTKIFQDDSQRKRESAAQSLVELTDELLTESYEHIQKISQAGQTVLRQRVRKVS